MARPVISLCLPSRGRPDALLAMIDSARHKAAGMVEVSVWLDDDDSELDRYAAMLDSRLGIPLSVGQRTTLSECWNLAARRATGDVLMLAADDLRFRTPGWDVLVAQAIDAVPDRIALVYGRDGIADERMATHPFVSSRWIETVGYFTPSMFPADYVDLWLHDVARSVDRAFYLPDLFIEHMHPSVGKGPVDACYEERLARARAADLPARYDSLSAERGAAADRLRSVMA